MLAFLPFLSRLRHWGPGSSLWQLVCGQSQAADERFDLLPWCIHCVRQLPWRREAAAQLEQLRGSIACQHTPPRLRPHLPALRICCLCSRARCPTYYPDSLLSGWRRPRKRGPCPGSSAHPVAAWAQPLGCYVQGHQPTLECWDFLSGGSKGGGRAAPGAYRGMGVEGCTDRNQCIPLKRVSEATVGVLGRITVDLTVNSGFQHDYHGLSEFPAGSPWDIQMGTSKAHVFMSKALSALGASSWLRLPSTGSPRVTTEPQTCSHNCV